MKQEKLEVKDPVDKKTILGSYDHYPVKHALLHQAVNWPGVMTAQTTLSNVKVPTLEMNLVPQAGILVLRAKGQEFWIRAENVASMIPGTP